MRIGVIKGALLCCMAGMLAGLWGCGLFPEEAQVDDTYRVAHYTPMGHETVKVERGDLDFSETVSLLYRSDEAKEYYLKYITNGEYFWNLGIKCYVVTGDIVKKGQLLAEAPCEELEAAISGYEKQISALRADIAYNKELLAVSKEGERQGYQTAIEDMEREIGVLGLRIQETENRLKDYRIYADMDGQVTEIVDYEYAGFDASKPFMQIKAMTGRFYGFVGKDACKLAEGDKVTAELSGKSIELTVDSVTEGEDDRLELALTGEGDFGESSKAKLVLTGDRAENVLYVPERAVAVEEDKAYVRFVAKDGLLRAKEIQVGSLINGNYVVTGGLEEGEEIVNE